MRSKYVASNVHDEVRALKNELDHARRAIIELMSQDVQTLLTGYYSCASRKETYDWRRDVAEEIIARAHILPPAHGSYFSDRAFCPLCGSGSTAPYDTGFALPEGLRRHLIGWGGQRSCIVMEAATNLARQYWHSQFDAAEQAEILDKAAKATKRRKTETLFRTAPDLEPALIDQGIFYGSCARSATELAWAEKRLEELKFTVNLELNVKSYIRDHGECVVYADPRTNGKIHFTAFPKGYKSRRGGPRFGLQWFHIQDTWRHDLLEKYETRAAEAFLKIKKK